MILTSQARKQILLWALSVVLLSACISSKAVSNTSKIDDLSTAPQQISEEIPATQPLSPTSDVADMHLLSQTINDITVEFTEAKVISTGLEIGICYTALDDGEWRPMPGHLFYDQYEIYPDEIEFLEGELVADGKSTGKRCALIRYRMNDLHTLTTPIEFSILQFYAPGREMYTPCQELQQRLDTNPKARAYGLKAQCVENSDGTISATLRDHAKSVANDHAKQVLEEIAKAEVDGPWEFTISEIER